MSKKTINVFEIHRAGEEIEILEVGCEYARTIKNGIVIPHIVMDKSVTAILKDGRIAICYKISFIKELKEDFIKTLSNERRIRKSCVSRAQSTGGKGTCQQL